MGIFGTAAHRIVSGCIPLMMWSRVLASPTVVIMSDIETMGVTVIEVTVEFILWVGLLRWKLHIGAGWHRWWSRNGWWLGSGRNGSALVGVLIAVVVITLAIHSTATSAASSSSAGVSSTTIKTWVMIILGHWLVWLRWWLLWWLRWWGGRSRRIVCMWLWYRRW